MTEKSDRWIGGGDALLDRPAWMATTEAQDRTESVEMPETFKSLAAAALAQHQPAIAAAFLLHTVERVAGLEAKS